MKTYFSHSFSRKSVIGFALTALVAASATVYAPPRRALSRASYVLTAKEQAQIARLRRVLICAIVFGVPTALSIGYLPWAIRAEKIAKNKALRDAVAAGNLEEAEKMLRRGADVNAHDEQTGRTPLHMANNPQMVNILMQAGGNPQARDAQGNEPVHAARDIALVRSLAEAGGDLNAPDGNGRVRLHHAAMANDQRMARELLAQGVDIGAEQGWAFRR